MAHGEFASADRAVRSVGRRVLATRRWGRSGEADQPLTTTQLELLDDVIREAERFTGLRFSAYLGDLGATPAASPRACCPGSAPMLRVACCWRSRRDSGWSRSSPGRRPPGGSVIGPRGWLCWRWSPRAPTATSPAHWSPASGSWPTRPALFRNAPPGSTRTAGRPAAWRVTPRSANQPPALLGSVRGSWRAGPVRCRPGPRRPAGATRRVIPGLPVRGQVDGSLLDRPPRVQADRDLLRHLDRAPLPDPGHLGEVLARRRARATRAGRDARSRAMAASCRALAIPSSSISRSHTAALFAASGSRARTMVARRIPDAVGSAAAAASISVDAGGRRARPAPPAGSRTGRCPPPVPATEPTRPASRRSRSVGRHRAWRRRTPARRPAGCHCRQSPPTASSCRAADTSGPTSLRGPNRVGVGADGDLELGQHPLQDADLILGGHAAHGERDEIPRPHQGVPGHLPDRRPQQGSRQRLGDICAMPSMAVDSEVGSSLALQ